MVDFTQYVRPNGRRRQESIERPKEIEDLAARFTAGGGWYEIEVLSDEITVSMTACMNVHDEAQDVEIRLCPNGPQVPDKVDELVRASISHLPLTPKD